MLTPFPFLCINLGLLLTHSALPAEEGLTRAVTDVQELAMRDAGEADYERPDTHVFVFCV